MTAAKGVCSGSVFSILSDALEYAARSDVSVGARMGIDGDVQSRVARSLSDGGDCQGVKKSILLELFVLSRFFEDLQNFRVPMGDLLISQILGRHTH